MMTGTLRRLAPVLLLPLLAAACTSSGASPTGAAPPTSTAAPSSPTASPSPGPTTRIPATDSTALLPCDVSGPWRIELELTGGFAGVERKLHLDQAGAYEARDDQTGRSEEGQAPPDLMAETQAGLPTLCQNTGTPPPPCPDCFLYAVETTLGGAEYKLLLNDGNLMANAAGPLVASLAAFLNEALQQ